MKHNLKYFLPLVIVFFSACNNNKENEVPRQQNTLIFPQGNKNTTDNFKEKYG